jgi:hypothetical protein
MTHTLLLRTLRQLSAKELRALREWVRCACFNRRPEVVRLCDHLCDHLHKTAQKALSAENLYAACFPGTAFNNSALRYTMSFLLDNTREYLAWHEWSSNEADYRQSLLRALRRRGMEYLFEKEQLAARASTEADSLRDARYYYQQYQINLEQAEHVSKSQRTTKLNLQPLPDQLTTFYISEMLRHACTARVHQEVGGQKYRIDLLEVILEAAGQEEMLQAPAVAVYYFGYKMLQSLDDADSFEQLKSALAQYVDCFTPEEMRGLYLMAINGCIRRMNAGKRQYIQEAFQLYKTALQHDFLTENGFLSGFTYKNVIRIGVALNEMTWTENFLEQNKTSLHPRERDNLYRYNLAFLRFRQQDYNLAMPLLQQVDFEDPLNNLDARRMLLRSYYELGETEALLAHLHSFATYLKRQKNLGYHRENNENLIYFTKKLIEIDRKNKTELEALKQDILASAAVAEREWLLAQC